jgi:hypothetical protein
MVRTVQCQRQFVEPLRRHNRHSLLGLAVAEQHRQAISDLADNIPLLFYRGTLLPTDGKETYFSIARLLVFMASATSSGICAPRLTIAVSRIGPAGSRLFAVRVLVARRDASPIV